MSTSDPRFCQKPNMLLSRWGALKVAVDRFVAALATTPQLEHVALVSYGSAYTACSFTNAASSINCPLSQNHATVTSAMATISNTKFNGATNIEAGILKGIEVLTSAGPALCGQNHGPHERRRTTPSVSSPAWSPRRPPPTTSSSTRSPSAKRTRMKWQAIADATGGNHYYRPRCRAALQEIFEEIALTLPVIFTD